MKVYQWFHYKTCWFNLVSKVAFSQSQQALFMYFTTIEQINVSSFTLNFISFSARSATMEFFRE